MNDGWLFAMRLFLIGLLVYAGLATWALSYLRRYSIAFWEGMTRAGIGLFFIASAFATLSSLLGFDPDLRVTLLTVSAGYTALGLTMTGVKESKTVIGGTKPRSTT
jgi:small-conductance mechanosensitive channel